MTMPDVDETEDKGFTAPAAAPGQLQSRHSKKEFEEFLDAPTKDDGILVLRDAYFQALEGDKSDSKHDWRKQAYIAWSCIPKSKRKPRTVDEFADLIGLSNTATIRHWRRKDPTIAERITQFPKDLLANHVADVFEAMVAVATSPSPQATPDRKLFLELTGLYNPKVRNEITGEGGREVELKHSGRIDTSPDLSKLSLEEMLLWRQMLEKTSESTND